MTCTAALLSRCHLHLKIALIEKHGPPLYEHEQANIPAAAAETNEQPSSVETHQQQQQQQLAALNDQDTSTAAAAASALSAPPDLAAAAAAAATAAAGDSSTATAAAAAAAAAAEAAAAAAPGQSSLVFQPFHPAWQRVLQCGKEPSIDPGFVRQLTGDDIVACFRAHWQQVGVAEVVLMICSVQHVICAVADWGQ
jgi:hypothetical protein